MRQKYQSLHQFGKLLVAQFGNHNRKQYRQREQYDYLHYGDNERVGYVSQNFGVGHQSSEVGKRPRSAIKRFKHGISSEIRVVLKRNQYARHGQIGKHQSKQYRRYYKGYQAFVFFKLVRQCVAFHCRALTSEMSSEAAESPPYFIFVPGAKLIVLPCKMRPKSSYVYKNQLHYLFAWYHALTASVAFAQPCCPLSLVRYSASLPVPSFIMMYI